LPIALARFLDFAGDGVPFWFTILADFFFNLNGLFNVIIFVITLKHARNTLIVKLNAPRKSIYATNFGITPFVVPSDAPPVPSLLSSQTAVSNTRDVKDIDRDIEKGNIEKETDRNSVFSVESFQSTDSQQPLTSHMK